MKRDQPGNTYQWDFPMEDIAAGIPQLVVFMALDQPDNAARMNPRPSTDDLFR